MFAVDHHYRIGASHDVCQDYAFSFSCDEYAWIAVADGCSQSHKFCGQTDVGARVLVSSIAEYAKYFHQLLAGASDDIFKKPLEIIMRTVILTDVRRKADIMSLSPFALDSTLVFCMMSGNITIIVSYGDSDLFVKTEGWDFKDIDWFNFGLPFTGYGSFTYDSNAPLYLSYELDHARLQSYKEQFNNDMVRLTIEPSGGGDEDVLEEGYTTHTDIRTMSIMVHDGTGPCIEEVTLSTDGIRSFVEDKEGIFGGRKLPKEEVRPHLMNFKSSKGRFVLRRMKNFERKDMKREGWYHYDDLAIASIKRIKNGS